MDLDSELTKPEIEVLRAGKHSKEVQVVINKIIKDWDRMENNKNNR